MKRLLIFFLYTNLFISVGAGLMAWRTLEVFEGDIVQHSWVIPYLLFWGTLFTYNLCAFYESELYSDKFSFISKYQNWYKRLFFLTVLAPLPVLFLLSFNQLIFLLHLGVISFFYTVPLSIELPQGASWRMRAWRNVPFLKTLLVAYVWGSATVIFPLLQEELWIKDPEKIRYFLAQSSFVLAITLPFDIRDYEIDKKANLKTFANTLGILPTKLLAVTLVVLAFFVLSLEFSNYFPEKVAYGLAIIGVVFSAKKRPEWYYTGFLDSLLWVAFLGGQIIS